MQYVLGNMLNGGGINPDGLSLDLQFATDKTLTARRGPTPVFTRSSGDNGGTTYFGPLVDFDLLGEIPTTGVTNGRASWFKSDGGDNITISYTGTRWRVIIVFDGIEEVYLAAPGSEWRPDQADWSSQEFTIITSGTFGIVKAANNEPRFDHDPVTGVCRGLLIEEARTNALQHSANFKSTTSSNYWENLSATTVTVDQITSPDGGMNADLLSTSATAFDCFFRRANIWAGSTQYTYSVFLKQGPSNHRYVGLYIGVGVSALKFPFFDFDNPTVVQIPSGVLVGAINSTRVDDYPNGWYRVIVTFTTAATPATTNCGAYISTSDGTLPASSAAGLDAYVWGIQSELGAFSTSYIPTTTAPLTRGADVCSITGDNFNNFYNQSEGTLFADVFGLMTDLLAGNRGFAVITDGTYNNQIGIYKVASAAFIGAAGNTGNVSQFTLNNAYVPFTQYKVALGVKTNDTNAAFNGSLKTTDTSVTLPSTMNRLEFRDATGAAGGQPSCHLAAIRYYKKRLPNAKLVTLTT
jgi:hypothetical protein